MLCNMWDYIQDDLTSIVMINEKTNTITIKIYGLENKLAAETFAHYTMSLLQFDYNSTGYSMPSTMIH
jgi:hypothetical protein